MNKTSHLRKLLEDSKLLVAPGAYDALCAKVIEQAGFNAVYMTGYGASASMLGQPDVGLLTMREMVDHARSIAQAVDIPVIADGDTGYGNPLNVRRTVGEFEDAGVCAIQLEDQTFPKKCGHMLGRTVVELEEMVQKINAAVDARQNDDFIIIARTDARTSYGLDEALRRGRAYQVAGADVIFIESPESKEELAMVSEAFPETPILANMIEGGRTPLLSAPELEELGFGIALYPTGALYAATKAVQEYIDTLMADGTSAGSSSLLISFEDFNNLVGVREYQSLEQRYRV